MTKPQLLFHLTLFLVFNSHSPELIFFSGCVLVSDCMFAYVSEFVSWGVTQRGRITRTQTDCEVLCLLRNLKGDGFLLSTGCLLAPQHHTRWTECLKRSAFEVWDDMRRRSPAEVPGSLEFWKQQCAEWQTPVLRWQRTELATQASCHWLFTVFCASICHRDSVRVSSSFSCTIKATSWQCWPCPLLSVTHKIKQHVFVLEFLCCCHIIMKLARWALYWNHSCFLLFFFWHFSAINSAPVVHRT